MKRSVLKFVSIFLIGLLCGAYFYNNNDDFFESLIADKDEKIVPSITPQKTIPNQNYSYVYGEVLKLIKDNYVETIEEQKFFDSALNGMLTSLDPHSSYFAKDEYTQLLADTEGEFSGLGIEVMMDNQMVKVVSPIDDTPAFVAGVKAGDYISHIDDKSVIGLTLMDCIKMMRGKDSKDKGIVKLTILRKGEQEPLEFKIKRDLIKTKSVKGRAEGLIVYIRIASFTATTYSDMIKEFNRIENKIGKKNVRGLVLDLRNNPGGLLDASVLISDAFLDKDKTIVSIKGKNGILLKEYKSKENEELIKGLPMVVLINEGSASASEIVSGALQDNKRAIILGTKSFGKGSVQSVIPLNTGGAIKLTVAKYYTPSGISIQAKGIVPDIEVKLAKLQEIENKFNYSEESLKGHLEQENNDALKKEITKQQLKTGNESMYNKDYQLARAIDLLLGISFYNNEK